ncbi:response regulator transcription factor, partial [Bizionia paragorgiae]
MFLSDTIAKRLSQTSKSKNNDAFYKKLSTREVEVLKLLSIGKRNKEVAEELSINEKTVSTYRSRLMKKLNVTNLVDLITQAKNIGL